MELVWWLGLLAVVAVLLAVDQGVVYRHGPPRLAVRLGWTFGWWTLAVAFGGLVWWLRGEEAGLTWYAGFTLETALSLDNVFVFVVLLADFEVPRHLRRKVLLWGVVGALVLRGLFFAVGAAALAAFEWVTWILAGYLFVLGARFIVVRGPHGRKQILRMLGFLRRRLPIHAEYEGGRLVVHHQGRRVATPLLFVILAIETMDLVFAVDSVPAILSFTRDPYLAYSSNVFAILCLRSVTALVQHAVRMFRHLSTALGAALVFLALRMVLEPWFPLSLADTLPVVALIVAAGIVASLLGPPRPGEVQEA